mmetsp:Transcript_113399/g.353531  ORF Transcript_113399/g.353531 Transcript_113399/m.353531 type:complete len:247 (-) Transcript_113399:82-822(-)
MSRTGPSGEVVFFPSMTSASDGKVEAMLTRSASALSFSLARGTEVRAAPALAPACVGRSCAASTATCCAPTARIFSSTFFSRCRLGGSSIWYSGSGSAGSQIRSASCSGMTLTGTSCSTRWSATLPVSENSKPRIGRPSRPLASLRVVRSLEAQLWNTCTRFARGASRSILFPLFDSMRYSLKRRTIWKWLQVWEPSSAPPRWQRAKESGVSFTMTEAGTPRFSAGRLSEARSRRCRACSTCRIMA